MKKISKIKEVPNYKLLKKLTWRFECYEPEDKTAHYVAKLGFEFINMGICFKENVILQVRNKKLLTKESLKGYHAVTFKGELNTYNHSLILSNKMDHLKADFNRTFNALDDLRTSIRLIDNASV
jgi:hypothetical protein